MASTSKTERLIGQSGSYTPVGNNAEEWSDSPSMSPPPQQQQQQRATTMMMGGAPSSPSQFSTMMSMMPQSYARILHWQTALKVLHVGLGILGVLYCIDVFSAAKQCYVNPCYQGPGLAALWEVNLGTSFTAVSSGIFTLLHAFLGMYLFASNMIQDDKSFFGEAHFVVGMFVGCTMCASLISLNMTFMWAAEWNLLGDLTRLDEYNRIFQESGRHMEVNEPLLHIFRRLCYLSVSIFVAHILVLIEMAVARKAFTAHYNLGGGGEGGGYVSALSGNEMKEIETPHHSSPTSVASPMAAAAPGSF